MQYSIIFNILYLIINSLNIINRSPKKVKNARNYVFIAKPVYSIASKRVYRVYGTIHI